MNNLTQRVLVAVVAIPLILLLSLAGGFYFFFFVVTASTWALMEFYGLAAAKGARPQRAAGVAFGLLLTAAFFNRRIVGVVAPALETRGWLMPLPDPTHTFLIVVVLGVVAVVLLELPRHGGSALLNVSTTLAGVFYVSLGFGTLVGLREVFVPLEFPVYRLVAPAGTDLTTEGVATLYRWGGWTVVALFGSIWVCDSLAYFAGRAFGRHKLFERVSPKKTWEGSVAGFAGAVGAFILFRWLFGLEYLGVADAAVCGAIVGLFGQLGDLAESLMKRDAAVKDSSATIPGHGGMLDRFDSLLVAAPLVFLYIDFVVCS